MGSISIGDRDRVDTILGHHASHLAERRSGAAAQDPGIHAVTDADTVECGGTVGHARIFADRGGQRNRRLRAEIEIRGMHERAPGTTGH
jgi:hypothetical protein